MRRYTLIAVVALVVLSGCAAPVSGPVDPVEADGSLGTIAGYAHDDVLGVDGTEALSQAELEAVTYRAMARLEVLRGLEFEEDVEVEIVSREEYREETGWADEPASAFTNELWRATFVVDGETDVNEAYDELYGAAVAGYYSNGEIVLVADDPDAITVDRRVLVHELVHALQDQHFGLGREGETLDERRAELGLIEGEAEYLPERYDERCGEEWECLETPSRTVAEPTDRGFNVGLFLSIFAPYSEGPTFVAHLHETGGWEAVDAAYDERPASTSQVIHPERYPDDRPLEVTVEDRSSGGWAPIVEDGDENESEAVVRTETVGEATLFATLWANGVIDRPLTEGAGEYSPYNYSHPITDGWAGDTFVAYEHEDGETGHVWTLAWETDEDAERFAAAYGNLLEQNGATELEDGLYRIPDGDFAGAYYVALEGDVVTIVGGPDVEAHEGIHGVEVDGSLEPSVSTQSVAGPVAAGLETVPRTPAAGAAAIAGPGR
ncbi:Hvo_1808 family surface protein [Natronobeatus ordinarius]|uniref:Hvo_1808 family surface protein n=1 Tax=Natronobeatus ordinarius TaxID=2963433 RepID=UPI0020CCF572|nr:Hvo_1808 family surface protein [Natronobeatus ordinarius]